MRRTQKMEEKPSPEEIREICQEIQGRWSESERLRRSYDKPCPWNVPRLHGEILEDPQVA